MARIARTFPCCLLIALVIAHGAEARKLLQAVGTKSYSGDTTAASSATSANIAATVAAAAKPGTATQAVKAAALKPLGASSTSTVSDSRYSTGTTTKFVSGAARGSDTAAQASTAATISSYASGSRPAPNPAVRLANVPSLAAQLPVGSTARGVGVATSLNAATSSAIDSRIEAQAAVAAKNSMPGPNIAGPKP
ncbi:hypothetical protein OEZ85_006573 [Tetradesmus obliquus]|uniref:Uncharacterized protein n=1 Tax=Tetradesmus obliquus TaxID=3088 RepID=A0ABY8TUZ7_TETOB|nr:hypothetical protein OEZ85_006573 [Tetradesmus obliquus]